MKKLTHILPEFARYFFILLFCYAGLSKAFDFENFQVQIGQSPILSAYAYFISYAILVTEAFVVVLLILPKTVFAGLYSATCLMSAFTIYIFLILHFSDFIPCSCGGILEKMGWSEHLIFNISCIILGAAACLVLHKRTGKEVSNISYYLLAGNLISVCIVVVLFMRSEYIIKHNNPFTRRFLPYPVIEEKSIRLDSPYYYFAGSDQGHLYLGNKQYPLKMLTINPNLQNIKSQILKPDPLNVPFKTLTLKVRSPYFYLADGTVPIIYRGTLGQTRAETISLKDAYFSEMVPLDSSLFAIKTFNSKTKQLSLALLKPSTTPSVQFYPRILERQTDGVFDSNGSFTYSDDPSRLAFIYSYRNQMIILNEQFSIVNRLRTIDSTKTARIQVTRLPDGRSKMSAPPFKVNQKMVMQGNLAIVASAVKGQFENKDLWKNAQVFDIYRIDRQEYIGSFAVYHRNGHKMSDFILADDSFYIISGKEVVKYRLREPIISNLKQGKPKT